MVTGTIADNSMSFSFSGTYYRVGLFTLLFLMGVFFWFNPLHVSASEFTQELSEGDSGQAVSKLQSFLRDSGSFVYPEITGYYGSVTVASVQDFQTTNNIVVSGSPSSTGFGRVGPKTLQALNNLQNNAFSHIQSSSHRITANQRVTVPIFSRELQRGVQGEDVRQLQIFLNNNGFFVSDKGAGSPGNETAGFFGKTQAALIRFQTTNGIFPATGQLTDQTKTNIILTVLTKALQQGNYLFQMLVPGVSELESQVVSFERPAPTNSTLITQKSPQTVVRSAESSSRDLAAPKVSLTAPSVGAVVSGDTVTVSADAVDNVGVASVQFKLNGANLGSIDKTSPYTVQWDTTVLADGVHTLTAVATDAAGNQTTASTVSVTVSNNTLTVNDQTLAFGEQTAANAGGIVPTLVGGPVVSAAIVSGNSSGHWQVASNGTLTPTVAGDTANLNAGPYTLGMTFSSGTDTDTATIVINPTADVFDVLNRSELETAIATAEATNPNTAYTIYIRDNSVIEGDPADFNYIRINGIEMNATLVDANEGAAEAVYDYAAKASFSGGSIHLTARTPYSVDINGRLHFAGTTGVKVSNLNFVLVPDSDSYNRDDGGPNTDSTAAASLYQAYVTSNATFPAESLIIFANNRFGGYAVNNNPLRWGNALGVAVAEQVIVEDNQFNGVYIAASFASVKRGVARRNTIENQLNDGLRAMGSIASDLTSFTSSRIEFTSNSIWNMATTSNWSGVHVDGIQMGTGSEEVNHDILVKQNIIYLSTPPSVYPSETTERSSQGIYLDDTPAGVTIDGVVAENFVLNTGSAGISLWRGAVEVRNNTVVKDTLNQTNSSNSGGSNIRVREGVGHMIQDNIVATINDEGGSFTAFDNHIIDHTASIGLVASYYDTFFGPFSVGSNGPSWVIDTSSSSTLSAGVAAVFAPKVNTLAVSRGFTNGKNDRTPDSFAFTNLTNQATSTLVYTVDQITGVSDSTFVTLSGAEWGAASTTNSGDVSQWSTELGTIDNNQYLHLRATTSASGAGITTATIQVGTATTSWSTQTISGGYVAEAVDFDGTSDFLNTTSFTSTSSKEGIISMWFYWDDIAWTSGTERLISLGTDSSQVRLELRAGSNGRVVFTGKNNANANLFQYVTPSATFTGSTWYHLLVSYDLANAQFDVFVNDTDFAPSPTLVDDSIEAVTRAGIGVGFTGSGALWNGFMADVFYDQVYVDLSVLANRRKFIDSAGKPVNLGLDGSTPLGSQPDMFLSGPTANWYTNKGKSGGFTETGEITTASSSPSD